MGSVQPAVCGLCTTEHCVLLGSARTLFFNAGGVLCVPPCMAYTATTTDAANTSNTCCAVCAATFGVQYAAHIHALARGRIFPRTNTGAHRCVHLSTGDIFRDHVQRNTELGKQASVAFV